MKALICGVNGQDGAYLDLFLIDKGMRYGVRRDMHEVKSDLKLIKWGIGLIIAAEVMPLMKIFLHSLQEFYDDQDF